MGTILAIADVLVLLGLVISVSRAVRRGQPQGSGPLALTIVIGIAVVIFAIVSFCAASGLAHNTAFNQVALLIFLIAIAVVARASWAKA
jgi:hypothetical protein